mgnify:CR=1 FL=1
MRRALGEFSLEGVKTTVPLLLEILHDDPFVSGDYHHRLPRGPPTGALARRCRSGGARVQERRSLMTTRPPLLEVLPGPGDSPTSRSTTASAS